MPVALPAPQAFSGALSAFHNCSPDLKVRIKEMTVKPAKPAEINETNLQLQRTPVAIIGMASLFPQARNLQEYWTNIINKIDCITDVPSSRWKIEDYYDPDPQARDKTYSKRGGFIPEVDFNPMEFGLPPNVLEYTDVSQLLGLVIAKETMEDAGYGESRAFDRERTGVILGVALGRQLMMPFSTRLQYPVWKKALKSSGLSDEDTQKVVEKIKSAYLEWDENAFPGMLANVVSGRIANRLDLGGMNCVVDAACASSLGALSLALSELTSYRAHMMLAGGVDTDNSPIAYMCFSKTPALTDQDQVRPFDAQSRGIMLGEGVGMILLKRLEDAERDQDRIYAVIRGIGSSSDGRYKSIYAPRPEGQVRALRRAYEDAGISPLTVDLIEAHGTGTMAGDPAEFQALAEVFSEHNPRKQHVALGTVKSQIGHTKAAAGAASMIKAALALHHKILPPTINVTQPHPKLNIENSPFYLNTETRPWVRHEEQGPRRASVSSFGFGGTNYHVVLEEYEHEHDQSYRLHPTPQSVLLAAEGPAQLLRQCEEALAKVNAEGGSAQYKEVMAACQASECPLPISAARVGFIAASQAECCERLQTAINCLKKNLQAESWEHPLGIYYRKTAFDTKGKVVALFSGQGAQYLHMGRELALNFPQLRQTYSRMDHLLTRDGLKSLSEVVFPPPGFTPEVKQIQTKALQQTEYAQPAIGAFSVSLFKILQGAGFQPDFAAGHSFGELTALWAAGVLREEDYFSLVKARGQAMAAPKNSGFDAGAMLAVKEEVEKVVVEIRDFPQITVSNVNSSRQIVLAGATAAIHQVQQVLQERGYDPVLLPVSAAFHTSLVRHAQEPFADAVAKIPFQQAKIPVYTNVMGKPYPAEPQAMQEILKKHLINPVLFRDEIENIYAAGGRCFVEFGPRHVLTNLVKDTLGDRPHLAVALNTSPQKNSDHQLREAVVQLQVAGLSLNNLDPYQRDYTTAKRQQSKKQSKLNVRLTGDSYVSEKTKKAQEEALNNGHQVVLKNTEKVLELNTLNSVSPFSENNGNKELTMAIKNGKHTDEFDESKVSTSVITSMSRAEPTSEKYTSVATRPPLTPASEGRNGVHHILDRVEWSLEQLMKHQSDLLQLHEQYLKYQMEFTKCFFQLMEHQSTLFLAEKQTAPTIESLERSMMRFHDHQAETLRIHEQSMEHQTAYGKDLVQLLQSQYDLMRKGGTELITNGTRSTTFRETTTEEKSNTSTALSEPTKNPVPLQQEQEVKVAHNIQQSIAEPLISARVSREPVVMPKAKAEAKPPASDMGHGNGTSKQGSPALETKPEPVTAVASPPTTPAPPTPAMDSSAVSEALLTVVSEKTGYPTEMLELGMDMEADLGIDSIKRVEILGALQDLFPDSPRPNPDVLAEMDLRTLGQVVDYTSSLVNASSLVTGNGHASGPSEDVSSLVVDQKQVPSSTETAQEVPVVETASIDFDVFNEALLKVVSEKTGYPTEMLELGMDMEADLGIDSIKRVEILGALQDLFPDLPRPNPDEIAEIDLRTLGQIIEHMQMQTATQKKKSLDPLDAEQTQFNHNILRVPVRLKFLPEPDFLEFKLIDNHISLITDDGSPMTSNLVRLLTGKGWRVVVLSFPHSAEVKQTLFPVGVDHFVLNDWSENDLKKQLTMIMDGYGPIAAFIHLHPFNQANQNHKIHYPEAEKNMLRHIFFMAKHLKQPLNEAASKERGFFYTVARLDGAFGLEQKVNFNAMGAGLFGLTKSLNFEWESVFCRAIDLSPTFDDEQAASCIVAELHDPNRYVREVGYGSQGRVTLTCS
jgi:acyl transferase domain-containing protein